MADLGGRTFHIPVTFGEDGVESTSADLNSGTVVGLFVSSDWDDANNIKFETRLTEDDDWSEIRDAEGTLVTVAASSGRYHALPAGAFNGLSNLRLVSIDESNQNAEQGDGPFDVVLVVRAFA